MELHSLWEQNASTSIFATRATQFALHSNDSPTVKHYWHVQNHVQNDKRVKAKQRDEKQQFRKNTSNKITP